MSDHKERLLDEDVDELDKLLTLLEMAIPLRGDEVKGSFSIRFFCLSHLCGVLQKQEDVRILNHPIHYNYHCRQPAEDSFLMECVTSVLRWSGWMDQLLRYFVHMMLPFQSGQAEDSSFGDAALWLLARKSLLKRRINKIF